MNAPLFNELRVGMPGRDPGRELDDKMNQVRDLLVGDLMRANEARMGALETRMRELETGLGQRLTQLHQRIEAIAADHTMDRQAAFDELAKCVLELSEKIRGVTR
jgi:hypothetical protein